MTPAPTSPHVTVDLVAIAANPLMRASASLLLLLGRLRASLSRAGTGQLMDQVAQSIVQFEVDARAAGVPSDQVNAANYGATKLRFIAPVPADSAIHCRSRIVEAVARPKGTLLTTEIEVAVVGADRPALLATMKKYGIEPYSPYVDAPEAHRPYAEDAVKDPMGNRFDVSTGMKDVRGGTGPDSRGASLLPALAPFAKSPAV